MYRGVIEALIDALAGERYGHPMNRAPGESATIGRLLERARGGARLDAGRWRSASRYCAISFKARAPDGMIQCTGWRVH